MYHGWMQRRRTEDAQRALIQGVTGAISAELLRMKERVDRGLSINVREMERTMDNLNKV